jgi:hypothetical protein
MDVFRRTFNSFKEFSGWVEHQSQGTILMIPEAMPNINMCGEEMSLQMKGISQVHMYVTHKPY